MKTTVGAALDLANVPLYRSGRRPEVMRLMPALQTGLKVLEVGCGEGVFSANIPEAKERWGIEPHPASAEMARSRLNYVFAQTFDDCKADLPAGYFDLVVCNDVIEHMTDHDAFLTAIQVHMAPDAVLIGSTPNVRFYGNLFNLMIARDWHYQDAGVLDRTHFRFFTFRSLRRSLEQAGFMVQQLVGLNPGRRNGWSARVCAEALFRDAIIALSAGAARDIRYLQIGFVAMRRIL